MGFNSGFKGLKELFAKLTEFTQLCQILLVFWVKTGRSRILKL